MRCCPYCGSEISAEKLRAVAGRSFTPTDRRVFDFIKDRDGVTTEQLARHIYGDGAVNRGLTEKAVRACVTRLRKSLKGTGYVIVNTTAPRGPVPAIYVIEEDDSGS